MRKALFGKNIKPEILKVISNAKVEISLAIAWISDIEIIDALVKQAHAGVKINVVLSSACNPIIANDIERKGNGNIAVFVLGKPNDNLMHHKFCIVDNKVIITGSYNYTVNALNNDENILVVDGDDVLVNSFKEEFGKLLTNFESNLETKSKPLWKRFNHTALIEDEQLGMIVGLTYEVWVANKNGKTKSGKTVTKGDWFCIEKKNS
jgi:phosphatidylserine/phosphatidylglycerophosphate/cardiolipin synthase-like enzyme